MIRTIQWDSGGRAQFPTVGAALDALIEAGYCQARDACLDSPHLKIGDLRLLRLCSVSEGLRAKRPELTEAEDRELMPRYVHAQTVAEESRNVAKRKKQRAKIEAKREKAISDANAEADGLTWLMDQGFPLDNVIFYAHSGKFCFGWRSKVGSEVSARILEMISEFPYPYTIKGTDRTWERA